jgi:serine/threonine protein kinase/Tol biopolymer transport system component
MPLARGARFGPYEVAVPIGKGGMGEVYRARDVRLDRDVALKVLPDSLAADAERLARFQREARTLASLNHPNIGGIHGIEEANGVSALVLELVEGPTLADRIAQGALPLDEALPIVRQIAEALEAAHEQGIIHRDLKPANIKVRADGRVKVIDFGLAKPTRSADARASDLTQSPTITSPAMATHAGIILGTAAYMSPEQARGKPLDKRTDVWAFGCVLYEMLTGRRAFKGDEVSDVIASVLAREPDLAELPAATPASIRRLIRRCLQKDLNERLRDIGDARIEIRDALAKTDQDGSVASPAPAKTRNWERTALIWTGGVIAAAFAVTLGLSALGTIIGLTRKPPAPPPEVRLEISTPPTPVPGSVAISPDGRTVAYVATANRQSRLWLRTLQSTDARPLTGTEGAQNPFWSPDSRSIAFFADNKLKRIDIDGGGTRVLTNVYRGTGGAWNQHGVIMFASLGDPISRISDTGGETAELKGLVQEGSNFTPRFLPDGRHFLYYVRGSQNARGVYVGDLDGTSPSRRLFDADAGAAYTASGYLLFVRERTLFAQRFHAGRLELTGTPFRVAEHSTTCTCLGLSVSDNGSIAYRSIATPPQRQFIWFDRSGKEVGKVADSSMSTPSLSPDGQRVVGYRGNPVDGNVDVWTLDVRRGVFTRMTSDPGDDVAPVWSPDGAQIAFSSNRRGTHDIFRIPASAGARETLVLRTDAEKSVSDWSPNGRFLVFDSHDSKRSTDIWAVSLDKPGEPFPVAQTSFDEYRAQFSPDGNWVAFQSDESGRDEIYVQPFPGGGNKWPISNTGGAEVRWRRDGKEIFYVGLDGRLMAVPIAFGSSGPVPGNPVALFEPPLGTTIQQADFRHQYTAASDGQRFLVATVSEPPSTPITVILNWTPPQ